MEEEMIGIENQNNFSNRPINPQPKKKFFLILLLGVIIFGVVVYLLFSDSSTALTSDDIQIQFPSIKETYSVGQTFQAEVEIGYTEESKAKGEFKVVDYIKREDLKYNCGGSGYSTFDTKRRTITKTFNPILGEDGGSLCGQKSFEQPGQYTIYLAAYDCGALIKEFDEPEACSDIYALDDDEIIESTIKPIKEATVTFQVIEQ